VFSVAEDVVIPPSPAAVDEAPADENKESTPQHGAAPASAAPDTQREARSKQQGKHKSGNKMQQILHLM